MSTRRLGRLGPPAVRYALLGPGVASLTVILLMDPAGMLSAALPTGVDLGGHVYPIAYWKEHWLARGRFHGWAPGWFGGFPLYYFYFPVPAGLVAALSVALPLASALKLVTVLGSVALPWTVWFVARSAGLPPASAAVTTLVGATVLLMESHQSLGGNLYSTLVGEFSFAWSLTFVMLYLGVLLRVQADGVQRPGSASLLLAMAAMSHLIPTLAVCLASAVTLIHRRARPTILRSWVVGFMLAGLWAVPFLVRTPYLAATQWAPRSWWEVVFPLELLIVLPLAIGGLRRVLREARRWTPLLAFTLLGPVLVLVPHLPMADRLAVPWYVGVHALAGVGIASLIERAGARRSPGSIVGAGAAVVLLIGLVTLRGPATVRDYAREVFAGYPAAPASAEFADLVRAIESLPPGRVHWQSDSTVARFGRLFALDVLPHLDPSHPTLVGLLRESSLTEPYASLVFRETSPAALLRFPAPEGQELFDFEKGVAHLKLLGVRYFVTVTPEGRAVADAHPGLHGVVMRRGYGIYEVEGASTLSVARTEPHWVLPERFEVESRTWFERAENLDRWVVAADPAPSAAVRVASSLRPGRDERAVSDYETGPGWIRFQAKELGVPHLVKAAYFPNWRVRGGEGPFRAAPSWMVVVPTEAEVELRFVSTWVEWVGAALSILGIGAWIAMGVLRTGGRRGGGRPPAVTAAKAPAR